MNNLGETRAELLAKLYALRGGLSVIYDEITATKKAKEKSDSYYRMLSSASTEKYRLSKEIEQSQKKLIDEKNKIEVGEKNIRISNKKKTTKAILISLAWIVGAIAVRVAIYYLATLIFQGQYPTNDWFWTWTLPLSIYGVGIFMAGKCLWEWLSSIDSAKWFKSQSEKNLERTTLRELGEQKSMQNSIERQNEIIMTNSKKYQVSKEELSNAIARRNQIYKELYPVLVREYSNLVSVDDWGNLDLIIYYLYSGRADSIKEALQLVDKHIEMNTLINAVNNASTSIQREIKGIEASINAKMNAEFAKMNNQLAQNRANLERKIENQGKEISAQAQKLSDVTSELVNQTRIKNSLLKDISVNSAEIANNVRQLRG